MSASAGKPRLWVVSELYYPEETSTGYFLTKIAEGLAPDFDVRVICSQPTYSERGIRAPVRETRNGTTVRRVGAFNFNKDNALGRVLNLISFTFGTAFHAVRHVGKGDTILVVTNPPTAAVVLGIISRLKRARANLLVHDVYPEVLVATGHVRSGSMIDRLASRFFNWTYRLFEHVIVLGRDMAEVVARKVDETKVHIIPNWGDVDEVVPLDHVENPFRHETVPGDHFVVQYSGNIGRTHDVETVLQAAELLAERRDILFQFVGYGGKSALVRSAACHLPNVSFIPRQPRDRLGQMLAASDLTIIPLIKGMYGLSVPSRMYNVMAAGTPILAVADPRSELGQTVAEHGAGWVYAENGAEGLAKLIGAIADPASRAEARRRGAAGRAAVCRQYSLAVVLAKFRSLLSGFGEETFTQAAPAPPRLETAPQTRGRP